MGFTDLKPILHYDANGFPYFGGSYYYATGSTTGITTGILVDNSPTVLHMCNVTVAGTGTITIRDGSVSGPIVAVINSATINQYQFSAHLTIGLFVICSASTVSSFTITYSSKNTGG